MVSLASLPVSPLPQNTYPDPAILGMIDVFCTMAVAQTVKIKREILSSHIRATTTDAATVTFGEVA